MGPVDIIIAICFIPALLNGLKKGFIDQIFGLISIVLGAWLSFRFAKIVNVWLAPSIHTSETWLTVISFVLIFVAVIIVLMIFARVLEHVIDLAMLGWLNRLLGIVLAIVNAALVIGLLIILFDTVNLKFALVNEETLNNSVLYVRLKDIAYIVFPYIKTLIFKQ